MSPPPLKPLRWIAAARHDYTALPPVVRATAGYALYLAQCGDRHPNAKPLKGFRGASVLEIVVDASGNTYRVVYTVSFHNAVLVLHAFMKKSKRGAATPRRDMGIVGARLKAAKDQMS